MNPSALSEAAAAARSLQALLGAGLVYLPGHAGYDRSRTPWNLAVEQRPVAVAVPTSAAQVVMVVRAAAAAGLRVVPQSTGHNAAPLAGRLDDALLLRLSDFTGVTIDQERRVARVLGGTQWHDVVEAAAAEGLAVAHGSGPDVAAAGYTLGGGLSWYARSLGLTCNQVVAAEVVLADGTLHRVHAANEPELFWALRGGGGSFGVVTALEFQLLPWREVYAGVMLWDAARAGEVCRAWSAWTHSCGDEATTALRLLGSPRRPDAHRIFPGRQMVVIDGAVVGDHDRAAEIIAPLRALGPAVDTFGPTPAIGLSRLHFEPELPTAGVSTHLLLDDFDAAAVDALVAAAGPDSTTSLLSAEIRHLGGALGRRDPAGGALDHIPGAYAGTFLAGAATPELRDRGLAEARRVADVLEPWSSGRRFLNFTEVRVDPDTAFDPATLARLRAVRAQVDPAGVFLPNHALD
jgi:FAD/FMN-containing dehydrogenase